MTEKPARRWGMPGGKKVGLGGGEEGILLEQVKNSQTFDEPVGWRFGFKSEGATHAMMILSPQ